MKQALLSISFDDGFKTDYTVAYAEMVAKGVPIKATSFICGNLTQAHRLQPSDMLALLNGGWDLQCHTFTHTYDPYLSDLTAEQIRTEITNNNNFFKNVLGVPEPKFMAYPGGNNNKFVHGVLSSYRKMMRTTRNNFITPHVELTNVPSFSFDANNLDYLKNVIDVCIKYGLYADIHCHELSVELGNIDKYKGILDHAIKTKIKLVNMTELYAELTKG